MPQVAARMASPDVYAGRYQRHRPEQTHLYRIVGAVKVIACIEDPAVIQKILTHLKEKAGPEPLGLLPSVRAPPTGLFG